MVTIRLNCNGFYIGIDTVVGKTVKATPNRAGYMVTATALREAGGSPCMHEYLFLKREVELVWQV